MRAPQEAISGQIRTLSSTGALATNPVIQFEANNLYLNKYMGIVASRVQLLRLAGRHQYFEDGCYFMVSITCVDRFFEILHQRRR